jgi:hypothetical protein
MKNISDAGKKRIRDIWAKVSTESDNREIEVEAFVKKLESLTDDDFKLKAKSIHSSLKDRTEPYEGLITNDLAWTLVVKETCNRNIDDVAKFVGLR